MLNLPIQITRGAPEQWTHSVISLKKGWKKALPYSPADSNTPFWIGNQRFICNDEKPNLLNVKQSASWSLPFSYVRWRSVSFTGTERLIHQLKHVCTCGQDATGCYYNHTFITLQHVMIFYRLGSISIWWQITQLHKLTHKPLFGTGQGSGALLSSPAIG